MSRLQKGINNVRPIHHGHLADPSKSNKRSVGVPHFAKHVSEDEKNKLFLRES
jgi:hypothetical protein